MKAILIGRGDEQEVDIAAQERSVHVRHATATDIYEISSMRDGTPVYKYAHSEPHPER